jgi:exosortase D (VPLPA-CTERM-specific)
MITVPGRSKPATEIPVVPALVIVAFCILIFLFRDSLGFMLARWQSVGHSHGFLVPLLVIALLGLRAESPDDLAAGNGAWIGVLLLILSLALLLFGELGAVYTVSQSGFVIGLWGLLLSVAGLRRFPVLWLPSLFLLFMVPLPPFLLNQFISMLQLIAASLGMLLIRATGLTVILEGNFVDAGAYQASVVEGSSSVHMVLPLFFIAASVSVLFRWRWWQRVLLLIFPVLIVVGVGGLRLAVTCLLAEHRDIGTAEAFLQSSAGVPLYLTCMGIFLLPVWVLVHRRPGGVAAAFALKWPAAGWVDRMLAPGRPGRPLSAAVAMLVMCALVSIVVSRPTMLSPERQHLDFFPQRLGDWQGSAGYVDPAALASLDLDDHLMASYQRPVDRFPVSLWVAWYDDQVYGASVHSPLACLPGAGWQVESLSRFVLPGTGQGGTPLTVSRAIVALGGERHLLYYWFSQRGRNLSSEYLVKWFIFQDVLLTQRSDGALIRLITPISDAASLAEADKRLTAFARDAVPVLRGFVPGADARLRAPLLNNR